MAPRRASAAPAAALLALAAAALLVAAASAAEAPEWSVYRKNLKAMTVGSAKTTVGEALGPLLDYEFNLPLEFMRRSQVGNRGSLTKRRGRGAS